MPHLMLEYSANVPAPRDFRPLFTELHRIVHEVGGVRLGNIKSRARRCDDYLIADGAAEHAFVHLEVWLLDRNALAQQQAVGRALLPPLRQAFAEAERRFSLQVTVQVRDVHRAAYFKHPEGTLTPTPPAPSIDQRR